MASKKYEVRPQWHRLNTCKAQYCHLQREGFEYWYLTSYESMICRVSHITYNGRDIWRLDLSPVWDCSQTTYQHLYKFFKKIPDCPFNPYHTQEAKSNLLHCGVHYYHFDNACILFIPYDSLLAWYRSNSCPENSFPCTFV